MDEKNELNALEADKDALKNAVAVARLQTEIMERQNRENRNLYRIIIAFFICLAIMAGCMGWVASNAQRVANEALLNALNTVAEMEVVGEGTTTTTQTVEGDNAEINNVEGNQYKDSATHYELPASSEETAE